MKEFLKLTIRKSVCSVIILSAFIYSCQNFLRDPKGKDEKVSISQVDSQKSSESNLGANQVGLSSATFPPIKEFSCSTLTESSDIRKTLHFASVVSKHKVDISYRHEITITIDGITYELNDYKNLISKEDFCRISDKADESIAAKMKILTAIAPICQFKIESSNSYYCHLDSEIEKNILSKLRNLQSLILKKSKRHPYLLVRRIAVALSASRFIKKNTAKLSSDTDRESLCNIVKLSLPLELPLTFRLEPVKKSICHKDPLTPVQQKIIRLAVSMAYKEIKSIYQKSKIENRVGVLAVKLAKEKGLGRNLWIELSPIVERSEDAPIKSLQNDLYIESCFHPLYSSNNSLFVDLISNLIQDSTFPGKCRQKISRFQKEFAYSKYELKAITSETEFAISNGWSKVLSLPLGQYRYIVRKNLNQISFKEDTMPKGIKVSGTISWKARRPRVTIH